MKEIKTSFKSSDSNLRTLTVSNFDFKVRIKISGVPSFFSVHSWFGSFEQRKAELQRRSELEFNFIS